jgi:hypothetical protein
VWQRFKYGAFGILKHQPIKPLRCLLNALMFKFSTFRAMFFTALRHWQFMLSICLSIKLAGKGEFAKKRQPLKIY